MNNTKILFPKGVNCLTANILDIITQDSKTIVVTDKTTFHPEDFLGGDQPGDRGILKLNGKILRILDAITLVFDKNKHEYVMPENKRQLRDGLASGEFACIVGHVIEQEIGAELSKGDEVVLEVDNEFRNKLSRLHSAVHIMSLALNSVLNPFWSKNPQFSDDLGNHNFDALAIDSSKLFADEIYQSEDLYRLGKSLRKKGFDFEKSVLAGSEGLTGAELSTKLQALSKEITDYANQIIAENAENSIEMKGDSDEAGSRFFWKTKIFGNEVQIPCGGTHAKQIGEIGKVKVSLSMPDTQSLLVVTEVIN